MNISKCLFSGLLLLSSVAIAQRGKEGPVTVITTGRIVNEYTTLTANASAGATTISVAASSLNANSRFSGGLATGDLIMIIQMQGVTANGGVVEFPAGSGTFYGVPNDNTWGQINSYNNCGRYEFCEVSAVPNGTSITLDCGLQYDYTSAGRVQVIRVPRYSTLTITAPGTITCPAWASAGFTGGIVSVEVSGNTVINNTNGFTVNGMGFRGGSIVGDNNTLNGGGQAAMQNSAEGAEKGEGVYGYQADYNLIGGRYCRGAAGNAGGGGNGHNAGGGGGANAGSLSGWDGLGNPDLSNAGWIAAWNLEGGTFSTHTSPGGGRGGYTFSANNLNATVDPPRPFQSGITNGWGGDYRTNSGGLGGRPLDYTTGRIFLGGGGGAGDQNSSQGASGGRGAGLVYIMSYGTVSGTGSITANGANGFNSGTDGAGGGGAGGTVIINSVGTVSGISVSANGGNGGNQVIPIFSTVQGEGPGGSGSGGYIAVSTGAITQTANPGANGTTDSNHLTEFPPNGATNGAAGLISQPITNFTITASGATICSGNTASLTASLTGTIPAGTTIYWYSAQTGGTSVGSGSPFTTPVLSGSTTYYVGTCPGTYRIPVVVTVNPGPNVSVNSAAVCGTVTTTLTASGTTTYTWSAGATSTGTNTATVSPSSTSTYTVTGTTGSCSSTAVSTITVSVPPAATFSYTGTPYCKNASNPSPTFSGGGTAGAFSSTAGLSINAGTGVVDLALSTPGTYTVTNTVPASGSCPGASATSSITITALPVATFSYTGTPYCQTGADPSPAFSGGGTAGAFTSTVGLSINSVNGLVDLSASTPGTYTVTNTIASSGGCPQVTATANITINAPPVATFSYTGTPYCKNAANPSPAFSGGGVAGTFTSTAGLSINSATGVVDLFVSTAGTYTVTNTIPAANGCAAVVATTSITITTLPVADFSYPSTPYCQNAADPSPVYNGGGTAGLFSSTSGISINSGNGLVDLSASTPGTYTVTNTISASGGCPAVIATSDITITAPQVASFNYSGTPYCQNDADPSPVFTGGGIAGTFTSTAGLSINSTTGLVDLSLSTPGTYTVTNTLTANGGCPITASNNTITITPVQNAAFSYSSSTFCQSGTDPLPTITGSAGGTFSSSPGGLTINSATGLITLSSSTLNTYSVTYTTAGPCTASSSVNVTITTSPVATFSYNASPYCQSGTDPSPTFSGGGTAGTFSSTAGLSINAGNGLIDLSASTPGTYTVTNTIPASGGCSAASATSSITINAAPSASFSYAATPYCQTAADPSPVLGAGATAGVFTSTAGLNLNSSTGLVDLSASTAGTYTVLNTVSAGCGNVDSSTITIVAIPDTTLTQPSSVCAGSAPFNLVAATSGGTWTGTGITDGVNGIFDPSVGAGSYIITYTLTGTCTVSSTVTVNVTNILDATIANTSSVCVGASPFNLSAATSGGTWSGTGITDVTNGTFDPATGVGSYVITYTLSGSCGSSDTETITVTNSSDATITQPAALCQSAAPITFTAATAGGTWSGTGITNPSTGTFDPSLAAIGNDTITYTIAGSCAATDTVVITIDPSADASITAPSSVCIGDPSFNLSGAASGGTWSGTGITSTTNGTFDPATAGIGSHLIKYIISGPCGDIDSVTINVTSLLDATITAVSPVCPGNAPFNLSAATSGGTWTGTGITDNVNGTFDPSIGAGTYTVTYTISGSCGNSDTEVITVNPPANSSINSVSPVCAGSSAFDLTAATAGGNWSGTGITNAVNGTFDPNVSGPGTFTITYLISIGCSSSSTQNVIVNALPTPSTTPDISNGCAPLCVQFTGSGSALCNSVSYDFGDGTTSSSSDPSHCYNAGTYSVTITCTDFNGCSGTNAVPVTINADAVPIAAISISPSSIVAPNTNVVFTDASTSGGNHIWNFGDPSSANNTSFLSSDSHTYTQEGTYCISLVSINNSGCIDSTTECITVVSDAVISIPNVFTPNGDGSNDVFFITSSGVKTLECTIYDRWGLKMAEFGSVNAGWNGRTSAGLVAPDGVYYYMVKITGMNEKVTEKQGFIQLLSK